MKRTVTFHTVHNQREMLAQGLPIDFPHKEELPLPAQHAQATTAGTYFSGGEKQSTFQKSAKHIKLQLGKLHKWSSLVPSSKYFQRDAYQLA